MRHAAKRDDTEPAIVKALELAGWTVVKVSDTGFPDLACFRRGVVKFLEVKSPKGTLTDAQEKTFGRIEAALVTVHVVRTPEEALMAVGAPVEGVLPLLAPPPRRTKLKDEAVVAFAKETADRLWTEVEAISGLAPLSPGHVVTPAYQQAQTAAVVPKKRSRPSKSAAAGGVVERETPPPPKTCECGHGKVLHQSFFTACIADGCDCTAYKKRK